ncbi:unnamed protein product [Clonostachys byssicola]|uniref:Uncharacterized protein n=1 Tax=Clonostachys byssicola TaxID=160290 RepID=A0A9N9UDL1_9HYPO|nr:unnamed protein product [Clonostachys byssicola]
MGGNGANQFTWFPSDKLDWGLDIVTLLAVIGESSIGDQSQAITASLFCVLPRLIPAPQALLKATRPTRMPETLAKMTGVLSGTTLESVGYFANIIQPLNELPAYSFKVLKIEHRENFQFEDVQVGTLATEYGWIRAVYTKLIKLLPGKTPEQLRLAMPRAPPRDDEEMAQLPHENGTTTARDFARPDEPPRPVQRRATLRETTQDFFTNPTMALSGERPAVPPKLWSPIHILSVFSCSISIAIVACGIAWKDGNAIISVTLISLTSTIVGIASFWRPRLMKRRHNNNVPPGDVMIRTREGAFLLIKCTEDVARELYSGTEECDYYVGERTYRLLMGIATTLLMVSVVLLGNCTWDLQMFIAGTYILLNGLYWALGMLPRSSFWDLSRYKWEDITKEDAQNAESVTDPNDQREGHPSFTRTLWYAIRETKSVGWVQTSGAAPVSEHWKEWLREAHINAREGNRDWNAVERKNQIMNTMNEETELGDLAGETAPATQVLRPGAVEGG